MRKNFLFIFLFLIMPMSVYADNSINLECPSSINEGEMFTCSLKGSTDIDIDSFKGNIIVSDNLTLIGFIPSDIWKGNGIDGIIDLYTEEGTNEFELGTIKLQSNDISSVNVTVESIFFYGSDDVENTVDNISRDIEVVESNIEEDTDSEEVKDIISSTYLADLEIDNYLLDFDKRNFSYRLEINNESMLTINPILEDNSSTVSIIGNENLVNGSVITIQVSSDDGSLQEYLINIVKNDLSNSSENDYSIIFIIIIIILVGINIARLVINRKNKVEE